MALWTQQRNLNTGQNNLQFPHGTTTDYRIAGNFWGRKLSKSLRFCSYLQKFSPQNWGTRQYGIFSHTQTHTFATIDMSSGADSLSHLCLLIGMPEGRQVSELVSFPSLPDHGKKIICTSMEWDQYTSMKWDQCSSMEWDQYTSMKWYQCTSMEWGQYTSMRDQCTSMEWDQYFNRKWDQCTSMEMHQYEMGSMSQYGMGLTCHNGDIVQPRY